MYNTCYINHKSSLSKPFISTQKKLSTEVYVRLRAQSLVRMGLTFWRTLRSKNVHVHGTIFFYSFNREKGKSLRCLWNLTPRKYDNGFRLFALPFAVKSFWYFFNAWIIYIFRISPSIQVSDSITKAVLETVLEIECL